MTSTDPPPSGSGRTSTHPRPDGPAADPLADDLVPEDDAIIGVAFRRSLMVLVAAGAVVAAIVALRPGDERTEQVLDKQVGAIEGLERELDVLPEVHFADVTAEAGITWTHASGAEGGKYLPETMGGGAAFFDFDGDGDPDLFLASSAPGTVGALYRNDGGHFTDVTDASGLAPDGRITYGMGAATGDYDGDGLPDLFLTGVGGNRLLRNAGEGRFEDVTAAVGVAGGADGWSTSAGFFDADADGDLDLFVCNYVRWSRTIDEALDFTLNGTDRAYGPPTNYEGSFSTLYRNEGDGTFSDMSEAAGIQVKNPATGAPMGKALGLVLADLDGDGDQDVFVANDTVQNHLFLNRGDGTFEERGFESGAGFDGSGKATGAMGVDLADIRGDGELGLCVANFAGEMTSLYVTRGAGADLRFSDDSMGEGIGSPSRQRLSFGLFFFDYDLDGRQDLLQVNGHLEESINEVQPSQTYLQPAQLFWNAGPEQRSCFTEVPLETTGDLAGGRAGRGSCYADYDGDGDLDVLVMEVGRRPTLLRNEQDLGNHWLRVRLEQPGANRAGLGAWVSVRAEGREQRQCVGATKSYLSQSELPLTFGLGGARQVEAVEVVWPDGERQEVVAPLWVDRELVITRQG